MLNSIPRFLAVSFVRRSKATKGWENFQKMIYLLTHRKHFERLSCSIKHHARQIRSLGIAPKCVQAQPEGLHTLGAAC